MSGNDLWGLRNSEDGADWMGKTRAVSQFCFAIGIRGSGRHLLGGKDYSLQQWTGANMRQWQFASSGRTVGLY